MSLNKDIKSVKIHAFADIKESLSFDLPSNVMNKWRASESTNTANNTIEILDVIGESFWDDSGVTAKKISQALKDIGSNDVVVNINSPGGDVFEGIAIYNLLRDHPHKVTVNIIGLAASAASIIAMAGDEINMGDASFLMIHNAWTRCVGNRHDMTKAAEVLEPFDNALANVYASRTGIDITEILQMMDADTYINSTQAVEKGFATGISNNSSDIKANDNRQIIATLETALIHAGHDSAERKSIMQQLSVINSNPETNKSTPQINNTTSNTHDQELVLAIQAMTEDLNNFY